MSYIEESIFKKPAYIRDFFINIYGYNLAKKRFNNDYKVFYELLVANLTKTEEEIKIEQFALLKNCLIHAYKNIPYYNYLFKSVGFIPFEFSDINQLNIIPLLNKSIIKENISQLVDPRALKNTYHLHKTSGSTGEKLIFFQPINLTFSKNAAFLYRFYGLHGINIKDKRVTIGGRKFTTRPPFWSYNRFENQLLMSSHHLNRHTVIDYVKKINEFKPVFIQGHPNSILFLARAILNINIKISYFVKAIFTTGETLVEENRKIIETAFRTNVYQQYGSGESCFSAQETPERIGYMLNYEHGFVELLGEAPYKEVIATSFLNPVMPFIRYQIGDFVKPISKNIQSKYPFPHLFNEVLGRTDDILKISNDEEILPVTIRMNVKPFLKEFTNYQLIQFDKKDFTLKLVDNNKEIDSKALLCSLKNILGESVQIRVEYVESLVTEGGKIRNITSKMS